MLNNYHYFLTLAEELSISSAAKRLFISHQCLSKYLKNMETAYGVTLFFHKPKFSLTPAGNVLLESFRQIELCEQNAKNQLTDIKESRAGTINFGITEGRYPIIIPKLFKKFNMYYPNVKLVVYNKTSPQMRDMILNNNLDLFLAGIANINDKNLVCRNILTEKLYVVISDNLLKKFFKDYPECKEHFSSGVDLAAFKDVPFVLNKKNFSSRVILDKHLASKGLFLNCINELTQPDMQYRLSAEDYAATCSLSMYIPSIKQLNYLNDLQNTNNHLNIFPIAGLTEGNPLGLIYHRHKIFPAYMDSFCKIITEICHSCLVTGFAV